jgi:hypothetical protein
MGLIQKLSNKKVFLDTAPLTYYIEENQQYSPIPDKLFLANSKGKFLFLTSTITLIEVLVMPIRQNELQVVEQYAEILYNSLTINLMEKCRNCQEGGR